MLHRLNELREGVPAGFYHGGKIVQRFARMPGMATLEFLQAIDLCKKTPGRTLSKEEFIHFLNQELPYQDAGAQFSLFVRWAHYGALFVYSKMTKHLSLLDILK